MQVTLEAGHRHDPPGADLDGWGNRPVRANRYKVSGCRPRRFAAWRIEMRSGANPSDPGAVDSLRRSSSTHRKRSVFWPVRRERFLSTEEFLAPRATGHRRNGTGLPFT